MRTASIEGRERGDWTERATATRWRSRLTAAAAGGLSVLAMAPFFLWPVLWLTLPALLLAVDAEARRSEQAPARFAPWQAHAAGRAGETGWWFGFGYHVAGLFWVGEAFLVEADIFAWLIPFAVTLLPAGLALFMAGATAFAAWAGRAGFARVMALALGLGVAEWLRGHILSGFPWNVLGYALTYPLALMQSASVAGIYGLTVLAALVFAGPVVLWRSGSARGRRAAIALAVLPLAAMWLHGAMRLKQTVDAAEAGPRVRIVQPSIVQRDKWRPENQRRIFDDHLSLSMTNAGGTVDDAAGVALIVWPEAAMPFLPLDEPVAMTEIGRLLQPGQTLIAGALRAERDPTTRQARQVFNSLLAFESGAPLAAVSGIYDKTHLVPFGEYLPLQAVLEAVGLQQLSRLRGGFAAGVEPRALMSVANVGRVAPLICYEALFPARIIQSRERPQALINVTNDGWFGNTTGPRQHFHMARVRAVEEGVPLVRSANNGISAVIDAYGRVVARLDMNVRGTIDARLPPAVAAPRYALWGDALFWIASVFIALWLIISHKTRP